MTKVYLPHFDNGMDYSDHSDITFGKLYTDVNEAIQFILNGAEGENLGEFDSYIIVDKNFFDEKYNETYTYNKKFPYLFKPDKNALPDYDYRKELDYDDIDEHAYIEILELV